jgi:cytochrome c2
MSRLRSWQAVAALALGAAASALGIAAAAPQRAEPPWPSSAADPTRGAQLIAALGCGSCHSIPGIDGARGLVGPPLDNIADRTIVAGVLPNTPDNMVTWLETPQRVVPGNAMPDMELNEHDARDIAAYLYTLR